MSLFLRHLLWTTLCPGTVTIFLPYLLLLNKPPQDELGIEHLIGGLLILIGAGILLGCIYMFIRYGKGTLSPADPARKLVINGLYRYVRNPMYVGVALILIGEALYSKETIMWVYLVIVIAAFNAFVILYEEPYLKREFGAQYDRYRKHVHRWLPGKPYSN